MFCDLHTHSYYSDGSNSPEELIRLAQERQLSAVVLCDHNTVAGLPEFLEAAAKTDVEAVPAVEFSTLYKGVELHILGLFILPEKYDEVTEFLKDVLVEKEESNRKLIERLGKAGIILDYEKIKSQVKGTVNRAVIGNEMCALGYVEDTKEAFRNYLDKTKGFYVPPALRLDTFDTIRFIKSIGAVAVLAHPFLDLDETALREFLPKAIEAGLDGMEVRYSKFGPEKTALAEKIAEEFKLLPSGGSDYHGKAKRDIDIGVGRGDLRIPDTFLEKLKSRWKE